MRVIVQPLPAYDKNGEICGGFVVIDANIFKSLLNALPNIEKLYIYCEDSNLVDYQLTSYIKALSSLKKLYLAGDCESLFYQFEQLKNTFSQLEFFFYNLPGFRPHPNYVRSIAISFYYIRHLHARNPRWLANVTQLIFTVGLNDKFDQVVYFLHRHATRLNELYIKFCDTALITPAVFGNLGKLPRLKEIALGPVTFEVLKQAANVIEHNQFTPLGTITTCNLVITDLRSVTVDQFSRVLLAIFPHVVNWKFSFVAKALDSFLAHLKHNSNFSCNTHPNVRQVKIIEKTVDEFFVLLNDNSSQCF